MASIGLSATRRDLLTVEYNCASNSVAEGAVLVHQTGGGSDDFNVVLPGGAAAGRVAGVNVSAGTASSGDVISLQKQGIAPVLLVASTAVTRGDELVIANTSGHVTPRTTEESGDVIGRSEVSRASNAAAQLIPVSLNIHAIIVAA